jgi:uncharacterized membrane protein
MLQESVVKIKDSLSQGKTREDVYKEMLAVGISLEEIENAFNQVNQEGVEKTSQDNTQKNAILIIVSIGALLIGVGIFSFIAANWSDLPKITKLLIIILSMVSSYTIGWFLREDFGYKKTGTALIFLGSLIYGAGIFLVAQVFNIRANWPDGFLLWLLGLLVMSMVIKSRAVYLTGIVVCIIYAFSYPVVFVDIRNVDPRLYGSNLLLLISMLLLFISGMKINKKLNSNLVKT